MNMLVEMSGGWNGDAGVPRKLSSGQPASPGSDIGPRSFRLSWVTCGSSYAGHSKEMCGKSEMWSLQSPFRAHQMPLHKQTKKTLTTQFRDSSQMKSQRTWTTNQESLNICRKRSSERRNNTVCATEIDIRIIIYRV